MPYLHAPEDLDQLTDPGPRYRADQLRDWLYRTPVMRADDMTNLPGDLRSQIGESLWPFEVEMEQSADRETTRKWLFRAPDGAAIESVLMGYPKRATLCISSQAGCALGCTFCATGQFGFERHLEAGEIVAQVAYAQAFLRQIGMPGVPDHVTNIVFMGMGEPFANYERVWWAVERIHRDIGISARHITISTVGVIPGIERLATEALPVNLAVSLHAANDDLRDELVPINRKYPIAELLDACRNYPGLSNAKRITFEYVMLKGVNDSLAEARELVRLLAGIPAKINLIPFNPWPGAPYECSDWEQIERFSEVVYRAGYASPVRSPRGRDIFAACGQLRSASVRLKTSERNKTPAQSTAEAEGSGD